MFQSHADDPFAPAPPVRVRTHPGLCTGSGECHRWAPEIYPLDDQGHVAVHLIDVPAADAEAAWWGASACPARAITVIGPPDDYWFERLRRRLEYTRQRALGVQEEQSPRDEGGDPPCWAHLQ